ncbi:hypothetical protein EfmAA290_31390 (plasmid) [Enterococcus faecium]|nr:hypothetical protein EfmAA290_31390 [Enterococcus faecium]
MPIVDLNFDLVKTELVEKGYTTISPIEKGFETGKYAMMLSGSWTMADLEENYQEIDYGILPYPVSDAAIKILLVFI